MRLVQPHGDVGIDWRNPLAKGLSLAYAPTMPRLERVSRRAPTLTGIVFAGGQAGRSFTAGGTTGDGVDFSSVQVISSSTDWTIAVLAAPAQTVGDQTGMFSQRSGTGNVEQINLMRGTSNLLADDERDFQIYYRNTSGSPFYADNGTSHVNGPDGALHLWGGSCTASVLDIWRDGINVTENRTTPSGTFVSSGQSTRLGNLAAFGSSGKYAKTCPMFLTLVWGARALSSVEWRELARNPWQVLGGIGRRKYFGPPTAGGAVLTRYYYDMIAA